MDVHITIKNIRGEGFIPRLAEVREMVNDIYAQLGADDYRDEIIISTTSEEERSLNEFNGTIEISQ